MTGHACHACHTHVTPDRAILPKPAAPCGGQQSAVLLGGYAHEEVSSLHRPHQPPRSARPLLAAPCAGEAEPLHTWCWPSHVTWVPTRDLGPLGLFGETPSAPLLGRGGLWSEDSRAPGKRQRSRGGRPSLAVLFRGRKRKGQSLLSARHRLHHLFQRNTEVVRLTVEAGWWWKGGGC